MLSANNSYFNSLFRMHVWILYRESVFGGVGWGGGRKEEMFSFVPWAE